MTKLVRTCAALAMAAGMLSIMPTANADEWNKKTILTVTEPVEIPGAVLEPGKYVMKLVDSQSNRHIVRFMNEDEDKTIATVIAIPNQRLRPTGDTQFGWYETPANQPPAMRAWFYPGNLFGQEFVYPADRGAEIAAATGRSVPTMENDKVMAVNGEGQQTTTETAAEANQQADQNKPMKAQVNVSEETVEIAQANAQREQKRKEEAERMAQQREREMEAQRQAQAQAQQQREQQERDQQLAAQRERQREDLERQRQRTEEAKAQLAQNNQQPTNQRELPETAGFTTFFGLLSGLSFGTAAFARRLRRR